MSVSSDLTHNLLNLEVLARLQIDLTTRFPDLTNRLKQKKKQESQKKDQRKPKKLTQKEIYPRATEDCECLICGSHYNEDTGNDWVQSMECKSCVQVGCITFAFHDRLTNCDYKK